MADSCWICNQTANVANQGGKSWYRVTCLRCGEYRITDEISTQRNPIPSSERHRLSYWCRQRALDSRDPPSFDSDSIKAIEAELPNPRPHTKSDLLLQSLGKLFPKPGQILKFEWDSDYPLSCAVDGAEMRFHVDSLKGRSLIHGEHGSEKITWSGWDRIEQLEKNPIVSKYVFVAFKFTDEMLAAWHTSFGTAIKEAGFDPIVASYPEHNDRIDAKIIADIKKSRFVVADVTGANPGVYFEAGFAIGLGRPVIWTCHVDREKTDMHFDTKQYNHILWKDYDDLRKKLYVRIVATI